MKEFNKRQSPPEPKWSNFNEYKEWETEFNKYVASIGADNTCGMLQELMEAKERRNNEIN